MTGPTLGFNVSATYESDGESTDISDEVENVDLGWTVGGGLDVQRLFIDVRYTFGLSSLFTEGDTGEGVKNRQAMVVAGFRF